MFSESDYGAIQAELVLGAGITTDCIDVLTIDDEIYEDDESFQITFPPAINNLISTGTPAPVFIIDNDGRTSICEYSVYHYLCLQK